MRVCANEDHPKVRVQHKQAQRRNHQQHHAFLMARTVSKCTILSELSCNSHFDVCPSFISKLQLRTVHSQFRFRYIAFLRMRANHDLEPIILLMRLLPPSYRTLLFHVRMERWMFVLYSEEPFVCMCLFSQLLACCSWTFLSIYLYLCWR